MKFLIWFGCFLTASILNIILGYAIGIKAGYLVIYFAVFFVSKKLCAKWDEYKEEKESKKRRVQSRVYAVQNAESTTSYKICFCRKCGERLLDNSRFCSNCGTQIVGEKEYE